MFWVSMALLTILLIFAGYWFGKLVGRKTDSGIGAFLIILLVTVTLAGGVLPLAALFGLGDMIAGAGQIGDPDAPFDNDEMISGVFKTFQAIGIACLSLIGFFVASLMGMGRGSEDA